MLQAISATCSRMAAASSSCPSSNNDTPSRFMTRRSADPFSPPFQPQHALDSHSRAAWLRPVRSRTSPYSAVSSPHRFDLSAIRRQQVSHRDPVSRFHRRFDLDSQLGDGSSGVMGSGRAQAWWLAAPTGPAQFPLRVPQQPSTRDPKPPSCLALVPTAERQHLRHCRADHVSQRSRNGKAPASAWPPFNVEIAPADRLVSSPAAPPARWCCGARGCCPASRAREQLPRACAAWSRVGACRTSA